MSLRRRLLAVLFSTLMVLGLAACNGDGDTPPADDAGIGDPGGDLPEEEDPLVDS